MPLSSSYHDEKIEEYVMLRMAPVVWCIAVVVYNGACDEEQWNC